MYTVYYIQNHPKDGLPYVGCTKDLDRRSKEHGVLLNEVEILYQSEYIIVASMMEQQEQELKLGQADGKYYHLLCSEDRNKALSNARKGVLLSAEHCQAISDGVKGVPKSPAHNKAVSDAHRGVPKSPAHCQAISDAQKGVPKSAKHCQSNSAGQKKRYETPAEREKISNAMKESWRRRKLAQQSLEQIQA